MANAYPLTTIETIRKYRLLHGEPIDDRPETIEFYEILIDVFTELFESFCGRKFQARTHTEYHDGEGDPVIIPNHYPIISASGVSIWDDTSSVPVWGSDTLVSSDDYYVDNEGYTIIRRSGYFGDGTGNVKVSYWAGYDTIPSDLEYACVSEVIRAVKRRNTMDVLNITGAEKSTSYIIDYFLPQTKAILSRYRRSTLASV
jgi:hypothetical protein